MAAHPGLPPNVHVSSHPCLIAKLSQLRSRSTNARETKSLIHDITLLLAAEALAKLPLVDAGQDETPLGFSYNHQTIDTSRITLVPILRSGLAMTDAMQSILPSPGPSIHHLGLFRDPSSLQPVEYYNNLPQSTNAVPKLAIVLDPVIATGGTCCAAIQTLRECGVERILVMSVMCAVEGVTQAANEWSEGTEVWVGGLDTELTDKGYIKPGIGDAGDRLFGTIGK